MADKSFGVKELNLLNTSGTPTVTSPNNLNLNANTVAISTSATVGNNLTVSGQINIGSNIKIGNAGVITATSYRGDGSQLTGISGISTDPSNVQATWKLGGGSGSGFTFTGPGQDGSEGNPDIYLVRGQRYLFDNTTLAGNHPFEFRNAANNADYTDGVSGAQNGLQYINVQHDAPAQLKYRCTIHNNSMLGDIYIMGGPEVISGVLTATTFKSESSSSGDYVRLYAGSGTGKWDIYGNGQYLRFSDNDSAGSVRIDTRLGVGSAASHAQLCSLTSGTGAIPTTGLIQTNNSNHALQLWNTDNSATYCGLMLETRTSGASGWLIANEWKSTYAGDLVFRGRNGGSSSEERLRITVAGNLQAAGITTSNTGFMFGTGGQHFLYQSAADTATLRITSDGPYVEFKDVSGDVQMGSASGTLRLSAGGNEKVRITSSEVKFTANQTFAANNTYYIGTNSNKLARNYSTKFIHREGTGSSVNGGGQNAEVIMFDGGGITMLHDNVTLTTAGPFSSMTCSRAGALLRMRNNGGPAIVSENGSITAAGASDYRIKENIVGITSAMSTVKKLNPVSYNIKKSWNPDDKGDRMQGFLAHEIQEAITDNVGIVYGKKDAVNSDGSIDTQVMEYGKLTPVLTAAIKELIAKVETLEAEVATLKGS